MGAHISIIREADIMHLVAKDIASKEIVRIEN